jgi:hypothetical protein
MLFDPLATSRRMDWIVIQLDTDADSQVGIFFAQTINFIQIDSCVVTIVIGKGDIPQPYSASRIDPRLKQRLCVSLYPMPLRVRVVVGKQA